jgi:aryl-alcohol dehydrogenase-like predicted oxidoreductase
MQKRRLGNSDLHITTLGFGAWAIGGTGWSFAWGHQDDDLSVSAIRRAIARGINWIDTAAIYGLGHSEEVVARALSDIPVRERPYVFTKCGLVADDKGVPHRVLKADSIRAELDASLRRLRVEAIDLYQIHWPNADNEEAWATLLQLQREGKVRYLGVSNFDAAQLERLLKLGPITSLQPPYSLIDREVEEQTLPFCHRHNIGVINYSPMYSGLLSGAMTKERATALPADDWRTRNPEFAMPRLERNLRLVEVLRAIGARHGRSPGEAAIAWTLRNPAITGAIVGARNGEQVDGFVGAADLSLSAQDVAEIDAFLANNPAERVSIL